MADAQRRELPGHIAAALAGAGGPVDSAGQPWAGRDLTSAAAPAHQFDDDDGSADPGYAAAVAALRSGSGTEAGVVAALATARVFVPVVAALAEESEGARGLQADKQADMALVTLKAPDGRTALPAFSSAAALEAWHPQARPVAVFAPRAALSAVAEDAQLMVLDPGADFTFVVRRPALWALARQQAWVPSYEDPAVAEAAAGVRLDASAIESVTVHRATGTGSVDAGGRRVDGGGPGPELRIVLQVRDGLDAAALQRLVERAQQHWARNEVFAERVDSLDLSVQRAQG